MQRRENTVCKRMAAGFILLQRCNTISSAQQHLTTSLTKLADWDKRKVSSASCTVQHHLGSLCPVLSPKEEPIAADLENAEPVTCAQLHTPVCIHTNSHLTHPTQTKEENQQSTNTMIMVVTLVSVIIQSKFIIIVLDLFYWYLQHDHNKALCHSPASCLFVPSAFSPSLSQPSPMFARFSCLTHIHTHVCLHSPLPSLSLTHPAPPRFFVLFSLHFYLTPPHSAYTPARHLLIPDSTS